MSEEFKATAGPEAAQDKGQQQQVVQLPIDQTGMTTTYSNFFRVVGTPEELILDFGLHTQQMTATGPEAVRLTDRLVVSYYTAKRLMLALQRAVNMHENSFGALETDFRRRLRGGQAGTPPGFGS